MDTAIQEQETEITDSVIVVPWGIENDHPRMSNMAIAGLQSHCL